MVSYDLYGIQAQTIDDARDIVERVIPIHFEQRNSDYQGGDYLFFGSEEAETFTIKPNVDPYDGEPVEAGFSAYPYLLFVDETNRAEQLRHALAGETDLITLLRHEDL